MTAIRRWELDLYRRLADGLAAIPGARIWGITDVARLEERTPTAAVTFDTLEPAAVSAALAAEGIAVWHGDFYATGLIERLGLEASGGVVRIGLTHYNTPAEIDRLLEALEAIVGRRGRPADQPAVAVM